MDKDTKAKLAALLRAAAGRAIPEDQFWKQFKAMVDPFTDPFAGDAFETATHFGGTSTREICFLSGLSLMCTSSCKARTHSIL